MDWRPAAPDLRPFVSAFAERHDAAAFAAMRELPVPLPLLQIMLGTDFYLDQTDGLAPAPRAALWGPSSRTVRSQTRRPLHVFVAVLTLRGAAVLARPSGVCLADRQMALDSLLPAASRLLFGRVSEASDFDQRVAAAECWLRHLSQGAPTADSATTTIDAMLAHRLSGPVRAIAQAAGISERALHKRCERLIGLPPKRLLRISRLQRVLASVHPSPWLRRADSSEALLEFSDDSHLAHDFKSLTGLTVSAYRRAKLSSGDRLVHTVIEA